MKIFHLLAFCATLFAQTLHAQCWSLVWEDNFNGTALNTADWNYWIGPAFNNELQYYTDRALNVKVENGNLKLIAREESYNGYNYTSGRIDTRYKVNFTYGRIEGRMKLVNGQGLWPAFWLLPTNGAWPAGGEMDIMELLGQEPNKTYGTCHFATNNVLTSIGGHYFLPSGNFADGFHIFAFEWSATDLKWFVDGVPYFTVTKTQVGAANWPFNKDFYVILNFAVGGNWPGPPTGTTFPKTMEVDYVKVFQKNPNIKIAGASLAEPNRAQVYKLPNWSGATYNWTAPGGTITAGQGTASATIIWPTNGVQSVSCSFTNACGTRTATLPVTVTPNRWVNPSFEQLLDQWTTSTSSGAAATFTAITNASAPNGSKIERTIVSALGPNSWNIQLSRLKVPVQKDTSYTLRFWAKANANGKQMQVNFLHPTNFTNYAWQNVALTTTWTQYQKVFTAPYTGDLLFTQDFNFQTGTFYVDNYYFGRTSLTTAVAPAADRAEVFGQELGSEMMDEAIEIAVSPNPVSDVLQISGPAQARYSVRDLTGKQLLAGNLPDAGTEQLNVRGLPAGLLLVEIQGLNGTQEVFKVLKN